MLHLALLPNFASPETWISLLTLTFLEIVLGIDNIIFISIVSNKLAADQQARARNIGLVLAMILRIILLLGVSYLVAMQSPVFSIHNEFFDGDFSGQSLILAVGGIFLLYKSTTEIHHKLEGSHAEDAQKVSKAAASFVNVIVQITLINIVFSFDSILTAIGLTKDFSIMVIAIVASVLIMMLFAGPVGQFVNRHPTIQMLGLAFLILIGFMLIAEGAHLAHLKVFDAEVGAVPKGYLYFAIAFSLFVEFLNLRLRRKSTEPVQLHGVQQTAVEEGILKP